MAEPEADGSTPSISQSPSASDDSSMASKERAHWLQYNQQLVSEIEQRLSQLESVRNYATVKKQRDDALANPSNSSVSQLEEDKGKLEAILRGSLGTGAPTEQEAQQQDAILGRSIRMAVDDPKRIARYLPVDYAELLIKVVAAICTVRNINPSIPTAEQHDRDLLSILGAARRLIISQLHPDREMIDDL